MIPPADKVAPSVDMIFFRRAFSITDMISTGIFMTDFLDPGRGTKKTENETIGRTP
jgi:hypothetical protein